MSETPKPLITDEEQLTGATRNGHPIPTYDDGYGQLYIHRDSMGISGIIQARTWEDAYGICEDEFFPEASDTLEDFQREYGCKREHVKVIRCAESIPEADRPAYLGANERVAIYPDDYPGGNLAGDFLRWETVETPDPDSWPDNELFQESYGFRPNGPNSTDKLNHGIYAKDLNGDRLDLLTPELLTDLGITIQTEPW